MPRDVVPHEDRRRRCAAYLEHTQEHVEVVRGIFGTIVHHIGASLVKAMEMALEAGDPAAAELVAAECVVHAETKDHLNWELLGYAMKRAKGGTAQALKDAHAKVEEQEDEHLYHTKGWSRELWIDALGMPAVLPPPQEEKDAKTAIGAARAKMARNTMKKAS